MPVAGSQSRTDFPAATASSAPTGRKTMLRTGSSKVSGDPIAEPSRTRQIRALPVSSFSQTAAASSRPD